jgi:multidrug resistance efflux pump
VDVYNPVDGRVRVISSRPDGARVGKGDVVCELDPAELQDRLASQEIVVRAAEAGRQGARLAREVAVMAVTEYQEGLFAQDVAAVEGEIKLAESTLARAEDGLDWTRRMFEKGYVSLFQKVSEELALKKAQFALERAQSRKNVLTHFTKGRTTKELLGSVETARARELSEQAALERERSALKRLSDQIRRCKVEAPSSGRVRYVTPIGAGAVVQDGQVLFRIVPDGTPPAVAK